MAEFMDLDGTREPNHLRHDILTIHNPFHPPKPSWSRRVKSHHQRLTCTLALQENSGDPKTALGQGVDMLKGGGGIFKSAAVTVLRQDRRLLTTAEITKYAIPS